MKDLTTEVWGLNFLTKGNRLCFIVRSPQGVEKRYWTDMPDKMAKAVNTEVDAHMAHKEELSKMTHQELAELYKEYGGS